MKKLLLFFALLLSYSGLSAQTMSPGDIAFVGYNTATPDGFSFIALKNLPGSETLFFTEQGWHGTGWMSSLTEPHLKFVLPASGIPKGTIISIIESSTPDVLVVTGITGATLTFALHSNFNLSGGDQILAYQSTGNTVAPASPIFIAGVHGDYNSTNYNTETKWNNARPNNTIETPWAATDSALPTGLENGKNCISLFPGVTEQASAKYTGTLIGTAEELLAKINNTTYWTKSGSNISIEPNTYSTSQINNSLPTAASVTFSGTLKIGQTLTGNYTYADYDGDSESGSTFKWYRSDNGAGLNKIQIASATGKTYTLVAADENKYISFEVTPKDGIALGNAVQGTLQGPVQPGVLPVGFGTVNANISSGRLLVDWETYSEADNKEFIIQASVDGANWTDLGTVASKAERGHSSELLTYSFSQQWSGLVLAGFGLLGLLLLPTAKNRLIRFSVLLLAVVSIVSCAKEQNELKTLKEAAKVSSSVYIRIAQVDMNGSTTYSDVVLANKK